MLSKEALNVTSATAKETPGRAGDIYSVNLPLSPMLLGEEIFLSAKVI